MSPSQIIVLATPVFLLLIAIELAVGWRRQRNTYRLADAVSSISLGALSQTSSFFNDTATTEIHTLPQHDALRIRTLAAMQPAQQRHLQL